MSAAGVFVSFRSLPERTLTCAECPRHIRPPAVNACRWRYLRNAVRSINRPSAGRGLVLPLVVLGIAAFNYTQLQGIEAVRPNLRGVAFRHGRALRGAGDEHRAVGEGAQCLSGSFLPARATAAPVESPVENSLTPAAVACFPVATFALQLRSHGQHTLAGSGTRRCACGSP